MTDEEIQREKEEAERLTQEIHATSDRINRIRQENQDLENEIEYSIRRIRELTENCRSVGRTLYEDMRDLSSKVSEAEIRTSHVFDALHEQVSAAPTIAITVPTPEQISAINSITLIPDGFC